MKNRLFDLLIGGLAGFVLAAGLSTLCYDQSVRRLQDYSHQVALSTATITVHLRARADTLRRRADSIAATRRTVIARVEQDTVSAALANRALLNARTVRDTNVALRLENQALRQAVGGLWVALQQSNQIIALERARGDSLDTALGQVNRQLQSLAARVEQLNPRPTLLRIAWRTVETVAIAKVSYDCGKRHCL